ncbi:MAG: hypothetical protein VCD00_10485 [Candidatus Hydrogenedentota bacterium]
MNAQKLNIPVELREPTDEEREVLESLGYVNQKTRAHQMQRTANHDTIGLSNNLFAISSPK